MKRFFETAHIHENWFRKLPPKIKCLWTYLNCMCDMAGVMEFDPEHASFMVGDDISLSDLDAFGGRVVQLPGNRVFLTEFVPFQYGTLSRECKPHKAVISALERHGISIEGQQIKGYSDGSGTVQDKDKEKDKEQVQEKDNSASSEKHHPDAVPILEFLNECTGKKFRATESNLSLISARLREPGVTVEGVQDMIRFKCHQWMGDPKMEEFLRPATLFGKEKFSNYYGSAPPIEPEPQQHTGPPSLPPEPAKPSYDPLAMLAEVARKRREAEEQQEQQSAGLFDDSFDGTF